MHFNVHLVNATMIGTMIVVQRHHAFHLIGIVMALKTARVAVTKKDVLVGGIIYEILRSLLNFLDSLKSDSLVNLDT